MLFGLQPLHWITFESVGMPKLCRTFASLANRAFRGRLGWKAECLGVAKASFARARHSWLRATLITAPASILRIRLTAPEAWRAPPAPCPAGSVFQPPASSALPQRARALLRESPRCQADVRPKPTLFHISRCHVSVARAPQPRQSCARR